MNDPNWTHRVEFFHKGSATGRNRYFSTLPAAAQAIISIGSAPAVASVHVYRISTDDRFLRWHYEEGHTALEKLSHRVRRDDW